MNVILMQTWAWVLIWIAIGILGFYIMLIVADLLFVLSFLRTMKKHNKALCVLYTSKLDHIRKFANIFNEKGIKTSNEFTSILDSLRSEVFKNQDDPKCTEAKGKLTYLQQEITFLLSKNQTLFDDPAVSLIKNNIEEIDRNLRLNSITYNADVLGYNYWVRFLPCRFIFLLAKTKLKDTI